MTKKAWTEDRRHAEFVLKGHAAAYHVRQPYKQLLFKKIKAFFEFVVRKKILTNPILAPNANVEVVY